jgi:hypothetical protein
MAIEANRFRLTVWRPADRTKRLLIFSRSADGEKSASENAEIEFHEEVYSWGPKEDIWLSVSDPEDQRKLKSLLIDPFAPERPSAERGMERLDAALEALRAVLADGPKTAWAECEETREVEGDNVNLRCHGIAALRNHLRWIYEMLKSVPGVSVTIR